MCAVVCGVCVDGCPLNHERQVLFVGCVQSSRHGSFCDVWACGGGEERFGGTYSWHVLSLCASAWLSNYMHQIRSWILTIMRWFRGVCARSVLLHGCKVAHVHQVYILGSNLDVTSIYGVHGDSPISLSARHQRWHQRSRPSVLSRWCVRSFLSFLNAVHEASWTIQDVCRRDEHSIVFSMSARRI